MTVSELMALLEACDSDAEVRIMSQENWPFENSIAGVAVREEFEREGCTCDAHLDEDHDEDCELSTELPRESGLAGSDVFILEGQQERYGNKAAWYVMAR